MAEENNIHTEASFLEDKKPAMKIHVKDILFIILRNLHWLVICGAIGAAIAGFHVRQQNRVYTSNARLLIRKATATSDDATLREVSIKNMFSRSPLYNSSVNNEMMIFTSKSALTEVAKTLKLNIYYTTKTRFVNRTKDLYGESPFTIDFVDDDEELNTNFIATIKDDNSLEISQAGYSPMTVPFEDTIATPFGRIVAHKTWFFTDSYKDVPITVTHTSLNAAADRYRGALRVFRPDESNSIISISINDASPIRATEIINEAIKVYNNDAVNDKKRIIAETYDFINGRISLLQTDLGIQQNALAHFKRENNLLNVRSLGETYLASSIQSSEEIERLRKQLSQARYLAQLNSSLDNTHLIPPTIELNDANIRDLIAHHNALVLDLDKYQSPNSPVVKAKLDELKNLRSNMNRLLDGYIGMLQWHHRLPRR